jgi:transposase
MPKREPRCKLGYHHVLNLILWVLYTGMQWKCLPVPKAPDGTDAIHYTTVYKVFARWSDDGSLDHAFIASMAHLLAHNHLNLSILHGDATNTVAKKGGDGIGYSGPQHKRAKKSSPSLTTMEIFWLRFPSRRLMKPIPFCYPRA